MRLLGLVLVLLGALALGHWGFVAGSRGQPAAVPPVIGGIVLVSGLLLISLRRNPV